ncbi:hypothetical protein ACHAXT_004272 [Thalassiosira profunda]
MASSSGATHRRMPPEIPVLDQALLDSYWCAETMKKRRGSRIDCPERKKLKFRLEPRVPEPAAPRPNVLYDLAALEMPTLDLTPTDGYHPNEGNFSTPIQITKISNEFPFFPKLSSVEASVNMMPQHLSLKPRFH